MIARLIETWPAGSLPPSKPLTGPAPPRRSVCALRVQPEAQVYVLEMMVSGEDVNDAEVLHDDHAGEIDEGDVWLIVILLPLTPGAAELLSRDVDNRWVPASALARSVLMVVWALAAGPVP